jgi:colanic acid biosynthesis glycosyl transferase WcaI
VSLRICITDYSGHPFQVELSRELACRGHTVLHLHFADFLTPKGRLVVAQNDPPTLAIEAVSLDRPFAKNSLFRRRFQEIEIGERIARRVHLFDPDIVVGCNLPLDSLRKLVKTCRTHGWPFVFWQQDIYSEAIGRILTKKLGFVGHVLGIYYKRMERQALHSSSAIVAIADDFVSALVNDFDIPADKVHVIENWAPLGDLTPRPKENAWTRSQGLENSQVILYTGTLGLKHDAAKLVAVAEALRSQTGVVLLVVSEGLAAEGLARESKQRGLQNLRVLPFQPFESYPDVLGSADVLIALLEADAGAFSVPSKVLSYLCSERAIVLSAPKDNLASRIIVKSDAGSSVAPDDVEGFTNSILRLLGDASARYEAGKSGRRYAERNFAVGPIASRFESIFGKACEPV